jgi:hypothetical protein
LAVRVCYPKETTHICQLKPINHERLLKDGL